MSILQRGKKTGYVGWTEGYGRGLRRSPRAVGLEKVDALNKVWGTNFTSWTVALEPVMLTAKQIKSAESDMLDLEALIAEQYFRETRGAVKNAAQH